jgi:hypothetical protein
VVQPLEARLLLRHHFSMMTSKTFLLLLQGASKQCHGCIRSLPNHQYFRDMPCRWSSICRHWNPKSRQPIAQLHLW